MSDDHELGEAEAKRLEALYTASAMEQRRQLVRDRLGLQPGEAVISVGCGPGFEPAELAEDVGERGRVYGIDVSEAMLELADRRCADLPQVTLERGDAVEDGASTSLSSCKC